MGFDKYSFDDGQQDDPWGSLRTIGQPSAGDNHTMGSPDVWNPPPNTPIVPADLERGTPSDEHTRMVQAAYGGGSAGVPGGDYRAFFMNMIGGRAPSPKTLESFESQLSQYGIKLLRNGRGWADKIQLPTGESFDVITAATANGGAGWAWQPDAATIDGTARGLMSTLSGDGHDVQSDGLNALIVDGRRYLVNQPARPTWQSSFEGRAPYTPTPITMDDLQGLGYQDVLTRLKTPVADATSDLVMSILKNPESLSDQVVDTLKAKSADELAEFARTDEEDLTRFAFANNLTGSNWLASERRGMQQARDKALVGSNRDIDILAAQTRMEDRRQAANVGQQFMTEERGREALASDVGLRQAAEKKDRLALNEQFKQKAAELQIDVDELKLNYTIAMMEDITRRWGIQVNADIEWAKLAQMGGQFQDELIFKMNELDRRMQLGYDELEFDYRKDAADRDLRERQGG